MASYIVTRRFVGVQTILVKDAKNKADAKRQAEEWDGECYRDDVPVVGLSHDVERQYAIKSTDIEREEQKAPPHD